MSDQQARQTPIIDLLRDIPADARMVYEVTSTHHQSIPVGVLAKQAADEIERLTAALRHEADCVEAAKAEIERLTAALQWEQHRAERQGTHGPGCADWGPAHYECAIRERDELRRQLAEAEQRFDWLTERLEDVQIDDADPNDHYYGDEEDVPYPVLWRRAIDEAMGATRPAEES